MTDVTDRRRRGSRAPFNDRNRRHAVEDGGVCWCGSTHDGERARSGRCTCSYDDCLRVHEKETQT